MKKTKGKTSTSIAEEKEAVPQEKEVPVVESKSLSPDSIFSSDKIDKLFNAEDPIQSTNILLQDHFRKVTGNANFDEEKLKAEAEYHINNLVFLKQNFSFDNDTISILMNILGKLIKFKNLNNTNTKPKSKVIQNESQENIDSVDISGNQLPDDTQNQNKNPAINDENQENNKENMDENELENENNNNNTVEEEVDFLIVSKDKLNEFKESLIKENLMPKTKSDFAFANNKNKIRTNGKFLLNLQEINKILKYIQTNFLPYIRMWYFFQNEKRNITERKIEVIINSPNLINMPLSMAVQEKTDEEKITEEEEKKKKMEEEKKLEEENQKKEEEEKKKEEESKKLTEEQSKEETYLDLLERLGLNEETKKVIIEKIEELHKEVDGKIDNRKKTLEDKIREIDETVHGKKK
jgi:hypothetical protein